MYFVNIQNTRGKRGMQFINITIVNWAKHNGKETEKTPNWFKVKVEIASSKSLFGLPLAPKWVWICLLSEAKKAKSATFKLNLKWASTHWELSEVDLLESLDLLKERGLIKTPVRLRVVSDQTPSELRADSESTSSALRGNSALEREREREEEREEKPSSSKGLVENENKIPEVLRDPSINDILSKCSEKVLKRWLEVYPDTNWIKAEVRKAKALEAVKPRKDISKYLTNWLNRSLNYNPPKATPKAQKPFELGDKYA